MNCSKETSIVTAPIFVPPTPRCRKPLSRMIDNPSPGKARVRYSRSPQRKSNFNYDNDSDNDNDISSDNSDVYEEKRMDERESSPCQQEKLYPRLPLEEIRRRQPQRSLANIESIQKTPKTPNETFCINSQNYEKARSCIPEKTETTEKFSESYKSTCQRNSISKVNNQKKRKFSPKKCVACAACVCIIVIALAFTFPNAVNSLNSSYKPEKLDILTNFHNDLRVISNKFPAQDSNTWQLIKAGISEVIKRPQRPWMFVLFSNETKELECLAECLGKVSSKALLSPNSLSLKPKDMGNDHGIAIDRWRNEIKKKKAVVVHDLLSIDTGAIEAFHTMCDAENPLVEEAVYIMTIITKVNVPGVQSPEEFVANQLTNRFNNKIPEDKLQPLITRIMDGPIIHIRREVSLNGCKNCIP